MLCPACSVILYERLALESPCTARAFSKTSGYSFSRDKADTGWGLPCLRRHDGGVSEKDGLPVLPGRRLRKVPGAAGRDREACDCGAVCGGAGQTGVALGAAAGRHFAQRAGGAPC